MFIIMLTITRRDCKSWENVERIWLTDELLPRDHPVTRSM